MFTLDTERERVLGEQPRDAPPETTPEGGRRSRHERPAAWATTIIVACVHVKSGSG
jgi:hypothetical protein